jgi:AcrR family transcriptional regulator
MAKRTKPAGRLTASARRTQLIEIARGVFAKRGYEATSMEEIASRAKVSKPIVYEHFGGKEGLYAVLVDREMEHVVTRIADAITTGTPRERVERAALAFLSYVRDQRDAPVALARGGMSSLLNDVAERVADVFSANFKRAGYDPKSAPIYAHALVGMVTFVGQWWTETRKPPIEEVASHLAALAWMGLRHLPKRPKLSLTPPA